MSTPTLSSVALNVVGQYHLAGKQLVRAWRTGTERAVGAVNARFASALDNRFVNDSVRTNLIGAQQQVAGYVAYGLALPAKGADITIEQLSRRVNVGIERIAGAMPLDKVGMFAVSAAQVSLKVAQVVAQGSQRLSERVAGVEEAAETVPAKKAPRKTAAAKSRTTRRA